MVIFLFVDYGERLINNIMKKKLIVIVGNLGAGKTTLAKKIGEKMNWYVGYESVVDNPYLTDFYSDMAKWSYHLQLYFLGFRAEQHKLASEYTQSSILDRSIYEDAHIFAKSLFKSGLLEERDYDSYMKLYHIVIENLPKPDLLVYVHAPIEVLKQRINQRGQKFDKDLSTEYLTMIEGAYQEWLNQFDDCPLINFDSSQLNYLDNETDFQFVLDEILLNSMD
jgi:deoxyadenosine/deoxycytidine kinase